MTALMPQAMTLEDRNIQDTLDLSEGQFQEAMREAEMADLKKQVEEINDAARSIARFDLVTEDLSKAASSSSTTAVVCEAAPALRRRLRANRPRGRSAPKAFAARASADAGRAPAPGDVESGNRPA